MDKTSHLFDKWANTGRAEEMEKGHGTTVNKFLDKLVFDKPFTFLDIGCGLGRSLVIANELGFGDLTSKMVKINN